MAISGYFFIFSIPTIFFPASGRHSFFYQNHTFDKLIDDCERATLMGSACFAEEFGQSNTLL